MKNIRDIFSQKIITLPDVIQFAKDRKFEESWVIHRNFPKPSDQKIDQYLQKEPFQKISVEYVWNADDDDNRFVLTIFFDEKCELQDPKKFIQISLDALYSYVNFPTLLSVFDSMVIGHDYLFVDPVESIVISVFNHWFSVGPEELWKIGEPYQKENIIQKIASRSDIEKTLLNYQGLFFRYNVSGKYNGPYYGIKTPCCNIVDNYWVVDNIKIDYWIRTVMENL